MKVIPERETLWVWLSKIFDIFELPVNKNTAVLSSSGHSKRKGKNKQNKDLLHTDDSTHSDDGPVPGLELIDDASLN